ncbi:hypothetical protein PM082_002343 [Marasmius tenuissimus]|nr:hypothetical protein PM082_002343 [Marasmius tenuissimus]
MQEYPEEYGFVNFKINIDLTALCLDKAEQLWAPPGHQVFELVPQDFEALITVVYAEIGRPPVCQENVWDVYMALLDCMEHLGEINSLPSASYDEDNENYPFRGDDRTLFTQLAKDINELQPLHDDTDDYDMGGVNQGLGMKGKMWDEKVLDMYVEISSDEEMEYMT